MNNVFKIKSIATFILSCLFFIGYSQTSPTTLTATGAGSFVVPCGVTTLSVKVWGAGGGGGGGTNTGTPGGSGGGGGAYTTATINVSPGQVITYFVGAGGNGGGAAGTKGGDSSFGTVIANGGNGGAENAGAVGTGGTGSGGTTINGSNGIVGSGTAGGAGGASSSGGTGGTGGTAGNNGNTGNAPGGGGGGGGQRSGGAESGGNGGNGQIIITWTPTISCISTTTTETITTCNAFWTDNGGSTGNYTNSQSYTKTFCPSSPGQIVRLDFSSFDTESGGAGTCADYVALWQSNVEGAPGTNDDIFCGTLGTFTIVSTSPSGCVTVKFVSNASTVRAGFVAQVSCVTPCTNPNSALTTSANVNLCSQSSTVPGSLAVPFNASASSSSGGTSISAYEWEWGDGTSTTTTSPLTTHTYPSTPSAAIYVAKLFVRDNNYGVDPLGCRSTNSTTRVVTLLPVVTFTGTNSVSPLPTTAITLSCSQSTTLTSEARSQTVTESPMALVPPNTGLPDGNGSSFTSTIDYSGFFPVGSTVSAGCYPTLTFNLEHSYSADLTIDLIAPSGETVRVFNRHGVFNCPGAGCMVGKFGTCANPSDVNTPVVPGCGADYTVVNSGGASWTATANLTAAPPTTNGNCSYTGACDLGNYYLPQTYNSTNSFAGFNGGDLNGVWSLRITDNASLDNGMLLTWGLTFPPSCYKPLESKTPDVSTLQWSHGGTGPSVPGTQPTTTTTIFDPGPGVCQTAGTCTGNMLRNNIVVGPFNTIGTYTYVATAVDEYGCNYNRSVNVVVTKPTVTVPTSVTACAGTVVPATTFTTTPVSTAATYAWSNSNTAIGLAASGVGNISTFTATNATTNTITATIVVTPTLGCVGTPSTYTISIFPAPTLVVTATSNTVCAGLPTTLTASGASSYTWSPATYLSGTSGNSVVSNPTATITYTATGVTTSSCNAIGTRVITVNPVATVTIGGSATICTNTSTTISFNGTANAITTYTINGGANQTITLNPSGIATLSTGNLTSATTYTLIGASLGSCSQAQTGNAIININSGAAPVTGFSYTSPVCTNSSNPSPNLVASFTTGGTFSAGAGVSVNASTGVIDLGSTTAGTHVITYTYPASGCSAVGVGTASITINTLPAATITYSNNPFCSNVTSLQSVTLTGTSGGTFSSGAGLSINTTNGNITPNTSTSGSYVVSYTIAAANGCSAVTATTPVTITTLPSATIAYSGTPFCSTVATNQSVTLTGTSGGNYTASPAGLTFNASSGDINPSSSTAGSYVVSYTVAANAGCPAVTATTSITVTALPTAAITYSSSPYCTSIASAQAVTRTGTAGGTYSASSPNLSINSASGAITPNLSIGGLYTVSYTINANAGCQAVIETTNLVISTMPSATITYAANPYCNSNSSTESITITGTLGGTFTSSPAGLSLTASNGNVVPSSSTSAAYVVSYTVAAANGCAAYTTTTPLTITTLPAATITYNATPYCKSIVTDQSVTRTGTVGGTYSASPAGLTINTSTGAINPGTSVAGTYIVSYSFAAAGGCSSVVTTAPLTISAVPVASAGSDKLLTCAITSIDVDGSSDIPGSGYSWTGPGIVGASNIATITVNAVGTYTLTVTSPSNCTNTDFAVVTNNITAPTGVDAGPVQTLTCAVTSLNLNGSSTTGGVDFAWTGGSIVSGANSATAVVNGDGVYTLTVTNPINGCSSTDVTTVVPDAGLPDADAGLDKILTCIITTVTLDGATTTPSTTYSWSGPGIVGASDVLTITANQAGTYTLTVTNTGSGCSNTSQVAIHLDNALPNVDAGSDDILTCLVTSITLNGSSTTSGVDFEWTGAGITGTTITSPTVTNPDTYTLTVTNPSNGCVNTDNVIISQDNVVPDADAGANQQITCVTSVLTLNGSSTAVGVDYNWSGVGFTSPTNVSSTTVNTDGVFTLTVTNPVNGCFATDEITVTINTITPDVSATPTATLTTCTNPTVDLSSSSVTANAQFLWTGPGITIGATTNTPTVNVDGIYTLTVTDPLNGCTNETTVEVFPNAGVPNITIPFSTYTLICGVTTLTVNGSSTTPGAVLSWTGTGIVSGENTDAVIINGAGVYTLTVTANGCDATGTVSVIPDSNAPVAIINPTNPEIACGSTTADLTALPSGMNYAWTGPSIVGSTTSETIQVDAEGVYSVVVTNPANSCSSAPVSITVTICTQTITANAGSNVTVCSNKANITLSGTTSSTTATSAWKTSGSGSFSNSASANTVYTPSSNDITIGSVFLIYEVTEGTETASDSLTATFLTAPEADFTTGLDTIYVNQSVTFTDASKNAVAWYWLFSSAIDDTSSMQNPVTTFESLGVYSITLTVTAVNGCKDTLVKEIEAKQAPIAVPEGFTPNGDGINDVLYVKGGPFKELDFRIFNQWGNEIFISDTQSNGWNGSYKEIMQPSGVFIYTVKATTFNDEKINFSGEVNLLH